MKEFLKVGISGVRGVVGESFTPQLAALFASAFGSLVGSGAVLVGRDTRPSGEMLERAVTAGLQSVGCKPILTGIVPTPSLAILVPEIGARGAIAITASHNPPEWNALKFIGRNGLYLGKHRAEELADIYHQGDFTYVREEAIPSVERLPDPTRPHFEKVIRYVNAGLIRHKNFRVAVDCCNGVGALHTRAFLEQLGCEVFTCHDTPSGAFERPPEPLPENLSALCSLVKKNSCAIGLAHDPDGDRLAIVDERGLPIGEDMTVALGIQQVLDQHQKGPVAVHLATSSSVHYVAKQRGCECVRTRIGEINVTEAMLEIGAVAGGEGNGGLIIPAIHPCRDSYAGMAIVLELLAMSGRSVSELCADIPRYYLVKDRVVVQGEKTSQVLRMLRRRYEAHKMNLLDGVHVEFDNAWFHVRSSNTEAVMRVVTEATSPELARQLADQIKSEIEAFLRS